MWELQLANPLEGKSMRKLLSLVAAAFVTIFSYLLFAVPNVSAADATWQQGSITYNNQTYRGPTQPTTDHNLPDGSSLYTYLEPQAAFASQKMHVIYFGPGTDTSTAATASYVTFDRGPTGNLANKSSVSNITIDTSTSAESQVAANDSTSSCKLDGIGWMICPITNGLAVGMDWVFNLISGFLKVRPLSTTTVDNTMYDAWSVMRNFANILFVVAFIIVIYSQLTSAGINNYGIKKILPRLIIAAILVNVSYWLCAIFIDISNILGYSFQDLFINLRNTILGNNANSWELISWESLAAFILSGGAIGGAAIAGATALTTTLAGSFAVGGLALVLAPILLGAFLTVMVVLLILAARQAIITLLVVIAPLAFVAYILPNTDKWFDKWRGLFMTMLLMFPAFSLIFGGSQLAGILIIQNAKDINTVLFGMAVQIAPLAITPLLFKLSGSLLGRIAGIINNPSKGVLDRTKNWSKDRLDARRADQMKKNFARDEAGTLGKRNFARRAALRYDRQKRLREGKKAIDESDANAMFLGTAAGRRLHEAQFTSNSLKERIETGVNVELKKTLNKVNSNLHDDNLLLEAVKTELKQEEGITERRLAEYRTKEYLGTDRGKEHNAAALTSLKKLRDFEHNVAVQGLATQSAKRKYDAEFAKYIKADKDAQLDAGGVEGVTGAQRALASAMKTEQTHHQDAVSNAGVIIDANNFRDDQITSVALGRQYDKDDRRIDIEITDDIREAAIKRTAGGKNAGEFVRLFKELDIAGLPEDLAQELGDSALTNPARPKWLGAATIGKIKQREVTSTGQDRINEWIISSVDGNKLGSAETLVNQDPDYLAEVITAMSDSTVRNRMKGPQRARIKDQIHMALHDNRYSGRIGEREDSFKALYNSLSDSVTENGAPESYEDAKHTKYRRSGT